MASKMRRVRDGRRRGSAGHSWICVLGGLKDGRMIRKIDTQLNFSAFLRQTVYYNRRYELRCGNPLEGGPADVRTVAARIGEARRRHQWIDFIDRAEPGEPVGQFAQKSPGRHPHGAG